MKKELNLEEEKYTETNDHLIGVSTAETEQPKAARILSIDRFRGLCMFIMVISFFLGIFDDAFENWTILFKHGDKGFQVLPGIAFADIFAPMFIFVVGLTFVRSFKSREEKFGTKRAYFQVAMRFLGLMGIGALLNGFEDGWLDVFNGEEFGSLGLNCKIFAVGFWIAIALVFVVVISRFIKNDKFKKISSDVLRYFLAIAGVLVLFFIIVSTGEKVGENFVDGFVSNKYGGWIWDTLQNIGLAGLIALPFVKFDKWGKLVIVSIAFAVMSIFMQNGGFQLANKILEGGLFGGISWAGILLLGCVFIELKDDKVYWILASMLLLISVVLIVAFDFIAAKRGCTPVYAMFTASLSAMIFAGLDRLNSFKPKFALFSWWGGSCLLVYVVNYLICLLLGAVMTVTEFVMPIWAAIPIIVTFMALYSVGNWLLSAKNKHIRL